MLLLSRIPILFLIAKNQVQGQFNQIEGNLQKMDKKYKEAAKRLAKQPPRVKQVDPLVGICAQKLQLINKRKLISKVPYLKGKETKTDGMNKAPNQNQKQSKVSGEVWLKYLPKEEDEFGEVQHIIQPKNMTLCDNNDVKKSTKIQNQLPTVSIEQSKSKVQEKKETIDGLDLEALKVKLGIGIKVQQNKIKVEEKNGMSKQSLSSLPFPGRPFEQAPEQPLPKKIYQYPPPCKIAAIYQWPPPKSDYRLWKMQMRESRKLT